MIAPRITRPNYRKDKKVGTRDYYNAYRIIGGTKFNREEFHKPYRDLLIALMDVMISNDIDLPLVHMKKSFIIRSIGHKEVVDFHQTNKLRKEIYPHLTMDEILKLPNKPVCKTWIERVRLFWLKGRSAYSNKNYYIKSKLYYFRASSVFRRKLWEEMINGKKYYLLYHGADQNS